MQLQVKQPVLYTNVINRHLQKYSHTQNFQNIQQTQLRKQTPNISNEIYMLCNKQHTGKSETTFQLRLKNHRKGLVTTSINTQNLQ